MNILLISHFFLPHKGGVETATYNTAENLSKLGHNVVVLTSKCGNEKRDFHKMNNFLVYRFKSFYPLRLKSFPQISNLGFMPTALFKIPKIIKKHKIDIIHVESRTFPISYLSTILNLIIFKKPMFISAQGRSKIGIAEKIENIFDKIITKHLYQKQNKIICVSESLKTLFLKHNIKENKLIVIPNGVDTSEFTKQNHSNFLDRYLNGKKDYKRVAFVGRLDAQKGVEYLIRAVPNVVKNYEKVHFFILGNGNLESKLKLLARKLQIQSNIKFLDFIPLENMPKFYSAADIFCLPSIYEGFPLSIAEALSMGLIIVASAVEGIPEAIIENENGYLVEPKNVSQLSYKLIKALNLDENRIKEIKKNNIKLAKSKYSWKIIVKELIKLYQDANN